LEISIPSLLSCPFCEHAEVTPRTPATYVCAVLGCAVGAAGGFHASNKGLSIASLPSTSLASAGFAFNGVAGAVVAAMTAAAIGCDLGAKAGAKIDLVLFDNYRCSACGKTFKV